MRLAFQIIWLIEIAAALATVVRIVVSRLPLRYPALLAFVSFDVLQNIILMSLAKSKPDYDVALSILAPIGWVIQCWLVVEIFGKWTARYPGIGTFGRGLLVSFSILSVTIGILIGHRSYPALEWTGLAGLYVIRASTVFALTLFLILTVWFFRRFFHPSAPQNLIAHTWISLFGFLALAARASALSGRVVPVVVLQFGMLLIWTSCYLSWLFLLSPAGELVKRPPRNLEDEAAIMAIDAEFTAGLRGLELARRLRSWWRQ